MRCKSSRPERLAWLALAWAAVAAAAAQTPAAPPAARDAQACESVVMVRCERPAASAATTAAATAARPAAPSATRPAAQTERARQARRVDERRRAFNEPLDLDRIIVEADPLKRSMEDAMGDAFPPLPPHGTHTITTAEGSLCSCMNRCPPIPFPCCQCAPHPSRFTRSPGVTPLR